VTEKSKRHIGPLARNSIQTRIRRSIRRLSRLIQTPQLRPKGPSLHLLTSSVVATNKPTTNSLPSPKPTMSSLTTKPGASTTNTATKASRSINLVTARDGTTTHLTSSRASSAAAAGTSGMGSSASSGGPTRRRALRCRSGTFIMAWRKTLRSRGR
jgi:hypothetical protein